MRVATAIEIFPCVQDRIWSLLQFIRKKGKNLATELYIECYPYTENDGDERPPLHKMMFFLFSACIRFILARHLLCTFRQMDYISYGCRHITHTISYNRNGWSSKRLVKFFFGWLHLFEMTECVHNQSALFAYVYGAAKNDTEIWFSNFGGNSPNRFCPYVSLLRRFKGTISMQVVWYSTNKTKMLAQLRAEWNRIKKIEEKKRLLTFIKMWRVNNLESKTNSKTAEM